MNVRFINTSNPYTYLAIGIGIIIIGQALTYLVLSILNVNISFFETYYSFFQGQPLIYTIPVLVILGPAFETLLFQMIPIDYLQRSTWKYSNALCIAVSTILFSAAHIANSSFYPLMVLPGGIVLAVTYLKFKDGMKGFLLTTALHAVYNLGLIVLLKMWY